MEENSMVRELITKILDENVPTETSTSSTSPTENDISLAPISASGNQYSKNEASNSYPAFNAFQDSSLFHLTQNEPNAYNFNVQNGFTNANGYVNYAENDPNLFLDPVSEVNAEVTPEHLNLLRLAAQEIGGAQFTNTNPIDKFSGYNFYEPSQRNSLPEANIFPNGFNRPNSLNLDMNYNNFENQFNGQRYPPNYIKDQSQESPELSSYLNQLNLAERRDDGFQNNDFKMPLDLNGYDDYKLHEERKQMALYSRSFMSKAFNGDNNNFYLNEMISQMGERSPMNPNYDFANQSNQTVGYKPNGFHPHSEWQRRDVKMVPREGFQSGSEQRMNYESAMVRESQQQALMRQNQEVARQMGLMLRNGPPTNQLNVDVGFLHENNPYNIANIGAMLAPNPSVPPPMVPSPMHDIPLLMPYYAMRNMRASVPSSSVLHARLDASYEQWKQLERERKRTEARLALAYPGRAVSSANSIPVPRLSQCPSRLERIAVDMYREHTKVVTLMGKMETLRASACAAQNRRPQRQEDTKITVLRRGQDARERDRDRDKARCEQEATALDPSAFEPASWREDVKALPTSPHKDIESALVQWKASVDYVLALRKREVNPHSAPPIPHANHMRFMRDPALEMADALRAMCKSARRVRCAMWYDLTLTVALASNPLPPAAAASDKPVQSPAGSVSPKRQEKLATPNVSPDNAAAKPDKVEAKEQEKPTPEPAQKPPVTTPSSDSTQEPSKPTNKQTERQEQQNRNQRRPQHTRHKLQRNDFYKHQRYDHRFVHRPPYYLATGPIN